MRSQPRYVAEIVKRCVHLLRHGEVENPKGVIYGRLPGFGLSARGREQATSAAQHLATIARGVPIVTSPLTRARETAELVAAVITSTVTIDDRLSEAHGAFDGLVRRGKLGEMARRALTPASWRENERPANIVRRMRDAVRATSGDVVIVSHQFPIWMARVAFEHEQRTLAAIAPWLFVRGRCELASITTLTFADDRLQHVRYWSGT